MTSFKILSPVAPSIISFLIHFPYSICPFIEALCLFPVYMWICLHSYSWLVCALRSFVRRQHAKLPVRELGAATKLAHTGWLFFCNCSFFKVKIFWNLPNSLFILWFKTLKFLPHFFLFLFPHFVKTILLLIHLTTAFSRAKVRKKLTLSTDSLWWWIILLFLKLLACYEILSNL